MDTLAILLPILMVGPAINRDADPELPRRSGLQTEATLGAAGLSGARDDGWQSMLGFTGRSHFSWRFLLGERWRLGPMLGASFALARTTDPAGSVLANGYGAFTLAPEIELELGGGGSLVGSIGPALVAGEAIYLGPEISLAIVQQMRVRETNRRVGFLVRGVVAPLFAVDVPGADAGYVAQLVFGLAAGMP